MDSGSISRAELSINDNIVNISSYSLSSDEVSVLSKGLSFVPVRRYDPFEVRVDLFKFFRKIRIQHFFTNQMTPAENILIVSKNSKWLPPPHTDPLIEAFECIVLKQIGEITESGKLPFQNLTLGEKCAIKSLQENSNIVIKPADKGGAVVILDTKKYIEEINRQLSDKSFYLRLDDDPTEKLKGSIDNLVLNAYEIGHITKKEKEFLIVDKPIMYSRIKWSNF